MTERNTSTHSNEWQSRPLCRRYLVVLFEHLPVRVRDGGLVRDLKAHWALGLHAEGQCDVLGVRIEPVSSAIDWQEVFDDLEDRGVETVKLVATSARQCVSAACPGATVLSSMAALQWHGPAGSARPDRNAVAAAIDPLQAAGPTQTARSARANLAARPRSKKCPAAVSSWPASLALHAPLCTLAPPWRRRIRCADEAAQRVHTRLVRAVARHGCFADQGAAESFLVEALQRVDRSLCAPQAGPQVYAGHRTLGAGSRSRIEASAL